MGLRIRTNVGSLKAQRYLTQNSEQLGESVEKLSSGYRINKSKDDAAGLAVSESMRAKSRGLNQARRNSYDAISMLQVAEGAMNEMSNMLIRMRELTVQSATDSLGEKERTYLNKEYVQLANEIDRISATTEFNGNKFFVPGNRDSFVIQVGTDNIIEDGVNLDTLSIDLQGLKFTTETLGIGKGAELGAIAIGEEGPTRDEIATRLDVLDDVLGHFASERANIGSLQSRLGSTITNLSVNVENLDTARSRIKDTDVAEETAELAKARILEQSNLSVLSQANQTPELALQLLR